MPQEALTPAVLHILIALARGHQHGYAIMRAAEESGGPRMGPGTVYASLQRMQEGGLVREAAADGRRRNFELTSAGRVALDHEAHRLGNLTRLLHEAGIVGGSK